jgi:peptidoglycan/LPS O-acetylase OafA/YrhL
MVFMVVDRRGAPQFGFLRSGLAAFFACISYALCLTHGCVLTLVFLAARTGRTIPGWNGAALTICAFAISVAICAASYALIEGPLIRMAHRKFSFGKPETASNESLTTANS